MIRAIVLFSPKQTILIASKLNCWKFHYEFTQAGNLFFFAKNIAYAMHKKFNWMVGWTKNTNEKYHWKYTSGIIYLYSRVYSLCISKYIILLHSPREMAIIIGIYLICISLTNEKSWKERTCIFFKFFFFLKKPPLY